MSRLNVFALIVLLFLFSSSFFSVRGCPPLELKSLLSFKSTLNDTVGMLRSWSGDDCCSWSGVKCSGEGRHVSKLDLGDFMLEGRRGEMGSSLFELKHLTYLDLSGNSFPGEIPSQLGRMSSLRHLKLNLFASNCEYDLEGLYFDVCIDALSSNLHWLSNLSSLEYLSLSHVYVRDKSWGSIIGSLLHLKYLDLTRCGLSDPTVPSTLLNLSSLTSLHLSHNLLSYIPISLGQLSSLTHLDLSYNNMSGSIPNSIRNMTDLKYLDLSFNVFAGQIPFSLCHTHLEYLDLSANAFTGQIPLSLCHNHRSLSHLILEGNKLEGIIPSSLGLLINLLVLDLGYNQIEGNIPATLGNLQKLRELYLFNNHLIGKLPLSFVNLSSLTYLDVSDNHLNGSIPFTMLPSSFQGLYLSNNNMNGSITEVLFQKCSRLKELSLSDSGFSINISSTWIPSFQLSTLLLKKCQIGGPIPSWISTQFSLYRLDLSANQLVGNLPSWIWDINEVHLSDNHLYGSFTPTSGSLRYLNLSMNELSGSLPANIDVHLSNAEVLILADNQFQGQIPNSIASLRFLYFLDMSNNRLSGNVPATLGNFYNLLALNLENNCLEGEIPMELGRLSYLQSLRIGKNSLQGFLPSSLRNLSGLQVLDVGGNNLTGNISSWIASFSSLHVLVMRSNNFRGNLPPEIGRIPELQVLDLSSNSFSGAIPYSYYTLPAMQNSSAEQGLLEIDSEHTGFTYSDSLDLIIKGQEMHYEYVISSLTCFDLSNNQLSGSLPPEIENLKGLIFLNLSMNSLRGPIPESLGNLVRLESMDLSFNQFSGRIQQQLGNLTFLARLNLSFNSLYGRIPQEGGQMFSFDESSFRGNPDLWGCPLEKNCSRALGGASPPPAVGVEDKRKEGFEFPWFWMCFGLFVGVGFSGVVMVLVLKIRWRIKCFEVMDSVIYMLPKPKSLWG